MREFCACGSVRGAGGDLRPYRNRLIHLKNNSTCQRFLYKAAMVNGGRTVLLVRNAKVLPVSGSMKRMRRSCSG
jgi:hypothetical protein